MASAREADEDENHKQEKFHGFSSQEEQAASIQKKLIKDFALASEESSDPPSESEDDAKVASNKKQSDKSNIQEEKSEPSTSQPGIEEEKSIPLSRDDKMDEEDKPSSTKKCFVDLKSTPSSNNPSPFRLKIKIGKDRSGEVVSPDLPADDAEGFHGFPDSEIQDFVCDNFKGVDLNSDFKFKPTIFVSISSKKQTSSSVTRKSLPALNKISAPSTPTEGSNTTPKTSRVRFLDMEADKPAKATPIIKPGAGGTPASSSKKKSGVQRYFEPLYDGWVREVVFLPNYKDPKCKNKANVYYLSPLVHGQKRLKFKSANELEGHLITTGSMYPLTFFTFRKEALGAPEGLEIVTYSSSKPEQSDPEMSSASETIQTLGKRVSKPPDKLITEVNNESAEVRSSKRVVKPPEKLLPEAIVRTKKMDMSVSLKVDKSGLWKDPENIVQSPKKSVTTGNGGGSGLGLLKIKNFSMLNAKSAPAPVVDDNIAVTDDELAEEDPLVINEPDLNPVTLSKVPRAFSMGDIRPKQIPRTYSHMPVLPAPTPTLSITPISIQQNRYPNMQAVTSSEHLPAMSGLQSIRPPSKIIRPTKKTMLPCSIHCPGVIGIPSLFCTSCHCLFHPMCVGLPATFPQGNLNFDFFCNDCQPKIPEPPKRPHVPFTTPSQVLPSPPPPRSSVIPPHQTPSPQVGKRTKQPEKAPVRAVKKPKGPLPPRPIEAQTMVSIAGKKFLVIPRSNIELDSPPPSPTSQLMETNEETTPGSEKLPVLLEPVDKTEGNVPRFEVEQSADGTLVLKPVGSVDPVKVFGKNNLKRSHDTNEAAPSKRQKKTSKFDFHATISSGYFAFLHVLKYLSVEERLKSAKVCKLWRELAYHNSLWTSLSLKNMKVYDWERLGEFLLKVGSRGIDLRKMVFVKDRDTTWSEVISVSPKFTYLRKIQLPRVSGPVLSELISCCPQLEILNSPLTTTPVDATTLGKVPNLKELRLKTGLGLLKIESGLKPLESLSGSLTSLSLLTVSGLADCDYDSIGTLTNLEHIELGDCTEAPLTIFKTLSDLLKLQRIRLEKGSVGENISKLQKSDNLRQLELIDFHVLPGFRTGLAGVDNIRKLLIIPTYKDEVARSNTEIIEGVTSNLKHLESFYLGVTNEWLEAMAMVIGDKQKHKAPGDRECFPVEKGDRVEYISLPGLYRRICREMPGSKVKVLKMSAGATCKQFIRSLDK